MYYSIVESGESLPLGLADFIEAAGGSDVVYVGELHQVPEVLSFERDLVAGLADAGREPSVGLEMFNVLQQRALDLYLAGALSAEKFMELYELSPEGFDLRRYMPLVDEAAGRRLRLIALNVPRDVASAVALKGLDAAELEGLRLREEDVREASRDYREMLSDVYRRHPHERISEENFILAQSIKDEMMAETIRYCLVGGLASSPLVVIAGKGHVEYGLGVPERVRGKMQRAGRPVTDVIITASYAGEAPGPGAADFFLLIP
ncbi:MAG: ChaN family lipoprotein [Thermodesulfovibrionales bacterium]